jgi:SAM-dependent methyltransferase
VLVHDARLAHEEDHVKGYGAETYGERWAGVYDSWCSSWFTEARTLESVEALADLAAGGTVLELAIGTARVALPLAARGLSVHGIDASEAMVAKLREKPGGDAIPVTIGDFADVAVDGAFDLVFVGFNTLFNLISQDDQVRCFHNVARHLTAGGVFVVEAFTPNIARLDGQTVRAFQVTTDSANLEASVHDPVSQTVQY